MRAGGEQAQLKGTPKGAGGGGQNSVSKPEDLRNPAPIRREGEKREGNELLAGPARPPTRQIRGKKKEDHGLNSRDLWKKQVADGERPET